MGKTSKFSFPIPGRRHKEVAPLQVPTARGNNLSKAQRILGTNNDLNIDISPIREEEHAWRHPGSRSSGMSISISESSAGSVHETDQWDRESSVLPRGHALSEKASSTLLGRRYMEDGMTTTSDRSGRLRNEDSSSTLKSYYDRQKIPLSISQQTSASSTRDMALRKGYPPAIQRSPLLQVETSLDPFDENFAARNENNKENDFSSNESPEKKKKPSRLDLSMLFPKSRRHGDKSPDSDYLSPSPSSASTNGSRSAGLNFDSTRRKLKKSQSKESMRSQKFSIRSERSHEQRQTNGTLLQLYDHYENLPARSPRMDQIPESRVPDRTSTRPGRENSHLKVEPVLKSTKHLNEPQSNTSEKEPFSWKNVRQSMTPSSSTPSSFTPQNLTPSSLTPPNWESTSAASISSRNTRTSKNTAGSLLSHSDLQEKSVLSLSSDSEGDSDTDPGFPLGPPSKSKNRISSAPSSPLPKEPKRQSTQQPGGLTTRSHGQKRLTSQEAPFLTVPELSTASSRLSGPWTPPQLDTPPPSSHQHHFHRPASKEKKSPSIKSGNSSQHPKPPSIASIQSLQMQTPPLSPSSMVFRQTSERSSRFMAVTQQEEALLEALRQKRARMREEIIEEHETTKTPPRVVETRASHFSSSTARSSVSTVRDPAASNKKQTILLYLDTPLSATKHIDTAEPSPDLDDFLSFGSDEESTPRHSWVPSRKGKPRPDSFVAPLHKEEKISPLTPPSAARLSAVGATRGFKTDRSSVLPKKRNTGVRFVDDRQIEANGDDFLLDDREPVLWNV